MPGVGGAGSLATPLLKPWSFSVCRTSLTFSPLLSTASVDAPQAVPQTWWVCPGSPMAAEGGHSARRRALLRGHLCAIVGVGCQAYC